MHSLNASIQSQQSSTTLVHAVTSSPPMNGSSALEHSNTPPMSPRSYSQQIPSPLFTSTPSIANGNPNMNNARAATYLHQYTPQSQPLEMYTSSAYSPISSPYYGLASNNLLSEHDVKIEGMAHTSPQHQTHHGHHQLNHLPQHSSRSPSNDESNASDLQSQIVSRNLERPSVVNIKHEN